MRITSTAAMYLDLSYGGNAMFPSTVHQTLTLTLATDGVGGYETIEFPATFTNLASVSWDHADHDAYCS